MSLPRSAASSASLRTPFIELDRQSWSRLRDRHPMSLTGQDVARISGVLSDLDLREVEEVYLPLSRLLTFYDEATESLHAATTRFLMEECSPARSPFVIGVAGSVAVGKSTTARLLRELLRRWPSTPKVELVTTDGFLYPNAVLEEKGLMARKGFPESYDRRALLRFVADVKAGAPEVRAPVYSHLVYDIVPDEYVTVHRPDVLIVEGLNVLQPPQVRSDGRVGLAVSDFFDFSVYVDAREEHIKRWYVERFLALKRTAFTDPTSYFRKWAHLSDEEATAMALGVWDDINGPNLRDNVETTRGRATLVLQKGEDHSVRKVLLRKL